MSALYAAGVSRARILQAVLKLALVIALITGLMSTLGRPWAFRTSYALESQAAAQFDLKQMSADEFVTMDGSDYTFIAQDVDLERGLHKGVFLQKNYDKEERSEIIIAESAAMPTLNPGQAMQATFYNGYNYLLDNSGQEDLTLKFKELVVQLPNEEAQEKYRRKAETTLNLSQLLEPQGCRGIPVANNYTASNGTSRLDCRATGPLRTEGIPLSQRFYCPASLHHAVLHDKRTAHSHGARYTRGDTGTVDCLCPAGWPVGSAGDVPKDETTMILQRYIGLSVVKGWVLVMVVLGAIFGLISFTQELDHTGYQYNTLAVARYTLLILPNQLVKSGPGDCATRQYRCAVQP